MLYIFFIYFRQCKTINLGYPMVNIVTKRFVECYRNLLDAGIVRSGRQFAFELDYSPQSWNKVLKYERDVTIELVRSAIDRFGLNAEYIFTGKGEPLVRHRESPATDSPEKQVSANTERITHVPVAAAAGYLTQFHDPVFLEDLSCFSLPGVDFRHGTFRAFDVVGDSMEPVIQQGEIVVCSYVDPDLWRFNVRNNFVYVVVTDSEIVVKRVRNNLKENGTLTLISDNDFYKPVEIRGEEIREMWYVKLKISPFSHASLPGQTNYENTIDDLKSVISSKNTQIIRMEQTIERLLKKERLKV